MRNAGLDKAQAGIKIARRNINNLRHADDTTLVAESDSIFWPVKWRQYLLDKQYLGHISGAQWSVTD